MEKPKTGFVYILTNPSFKEDWVKIGKSSRPVDVRSKELDNTAVPLPFDIYATLQTCKYSEVERLVHKTIDRLTDLRIRQSREFFNITPGEALSILKDIAMTLDDAVIKEYHKEDVVEPISTEKIEPRHQKRKAFWTEFIQYCKDNDGVFGNNTPTGDNWLSKTIRVPTKYGVSMSVVIGNNFARTEIYFNTGKKEFNKEIFDYLYSRKNEIENEYGKELGWERLSDKVTCRIKDEKEFPCFDLEDKTEVFKFLKDTSERMGELFHNYILDFKIE